MPEMSKNQFDVDPSRVTDAPISKPRSKADVGSDRREITDGSFRRIGHMWPEDFEALLKASFGHGWIAQFSRYAGMSRDTIDMYRKGKLPIPKHIAVLVILIRQHALTNSISRTNHFPEPDTPWLE